MAKKINKNRGGYRVYDEDTWESDENTWAVSFSDISTIMLVFFILLLSFSVINPNKYEMVQKSIKGADVETTNIKKLEDQIDDVVRDAKVNNSVTVTPDELGLNIEIRDKLMFESGSAVLNRSTRGVILEIVRELRKLPKEYKFFIEGHTDDVPINDKDYRSNWHLSAARALSVLNIFSDLGISDERLRVEGLADTAPLEGYPLRDENNNPIPENRERNRRVVIKVR